MVTISPFVDEGLGNSSYLVDVGDGRGFVVDPTRDVRSYERFAEQHGLELAYSLETHLHADFVSGGPSSCASRALRGPVLDVRQTAEYVGGHVAGATLLELGSLPAQAADLASGAITVMCGHGERAATAASLLERAVGRPSVFVGGAGDWSRALDRPLATGA